MKSLIIIGFVAFFVPIMAWYVGDGGLTYWDYDCDFRLHDIAKVTASSGKKNNNICITI